MLRQTLRQSRLSFFKDKDPCQRMYSVFPQTSGTSQEKGETKTWTKTTVNTIRRKYAQKEPIVVMTACDYSSARIVDRAGCDMTLVGDSLGMVALGYRTTHQVTVDDMLHHCRAVARGNKSPFLIGDMPFGSYEESPDQAVRSAIRFIKEGSVEAVKLEGGVRMAKTVSAIVNAGIPVMGHIGLTPQSFYSLGGFVIQGKTADKACRLVEDALALQDAGAFSVVLEGIPDRIARYITDHIKIPTIGIGAGPGTSGQVLVFHDVLGLHDHIPKFCKQYANIFQSSVSAIQQYKEDVKQGTFPEQQHSAFIKDEEYELFLKLANRMTTPSKDN
eukprot:TRINITY_DN6324_c0_g1_i1.p1 TRINITY_DN6324_c0_g1~~TRINITY_DN6324_c0_g1_i1.p1  ORF type:complete len:331 (-),score=62.49 TRINITY_DN6324_c0_g1_i1:27-1019(-)